MNGLVKFKVASVQNQSGAVLVVSLILLVVITIVGLSTIGSTTVGVQMAANAQFKNRVFQESENAIEDTAVDIALLGSAYNASLVDPNPTWPTKNVTTASSANGYLSSQSEVQFIGFSNPSGDASGSIRIGASGYSLYNFEVRGSASIDNSGATNTNVRGAYILGARAD